MHISKNILLIRSILGETQENFGKRFGATKAMIISYEKGKASPDDLFVDRLARLACVEAGDLLTKHLKENDLRVEKEENVVKESGAVYTKSNSLDNLSESNVRMARAHETLANSHAELVQMLKAANAEKGNDAADLSTQADFLELLAEIGYSAGKWRTKKEALSAVHRFSVAALKGKKVIGIRDGSGK